MTSTLLHRAIASASVAFLLVLGAASSAGADNVFWQGRHSRVWDHFNPFADLNNWYTRAPRKGVARPPPGRFDTAILAPGAKDHVILSSGPVRISSMVFSSDIKRYAISIEDGFQILGRGIFNQSRTPPHFVVRGTGHLSFRGAAGIRSSGHGLGRRSASIAIHEGGHLEFANHSQGGNASITNQGSIAFFGSSSAESMTITNVSSAGQLNRSETKFLGKSTGGNARLVNGFQAILDFSDTNGPLNNRSVTAGSISNAGVLDIGENTLTVEQFEQTEGSSSLRMTIPPEPLLPGSVRVTGEAVLGGRLEIFFEGGRRPGQYTILEAEGGRIGTFTLGNANMGRLAYSAKEVKLIVD